MRYLAAIAAITLAVSITGTASAIPLGGSAGAASGSQQEVPPGGQRATAAYAPRDITLSASKRHAAENGAQQALPPGGQRTSAAYAAGDITLSASRRHAAEHGVITISSPPLALPAPDGGGLSALAIIVIAIGGSLAFTALGFAGGRRTSPRRALG
jgi:hypothetical protein